LPIFASEEQEEYNALQENSTAKIKVCVGNQSGYGTDNENNNENTTMKTTPWNHKFNYWNGQSHRKLRKMRTGKKPASRIKLQ
jgi:hypothetical protein